MTSRNIFTTIALFLCLAVIPAAAVDASPMETQMRQLLQNKIIGLRMPYTAAELNYDANGQLIGSSEVGPWTLYGSIQINEVSLKDTAFTLDAERVILVLPSGKSTLTPMLTGRKVRVSLTLTAPVDDNSIRGALGDVFSMSSVDEHFASYWKPAVENLMNMEKPCKAIQKSSPDGVVGALANIPAYACVKGNVVSKPNGITTPAPGADAKKPMDGSASVRVIVDENGYPAIIQALKSSNGNYGIAAIVAVSQWKYSPAMKDGKAVPYMLDIELGKTAAAAAADNDKD